MNIAVGDSFRYQTYVNSLSSLQAQMDQTSQEVSSGIKVQSPSDNPTNYAQNLEVLAQQSQNTQYKNNLNSLQTAGSYYQTSVNSLSNALTTIQQLAVQAASSTADSDSRSTAGTEVNDLIEQLAAVGNTKVGDTYLFGGTESNNPAYAVDTSSGTPVVTFQGSANVGQVAVSSSTTVAAGISGQSIFTETVNGQSVDIFQTLQTFSEDLNNTNDLTSDQQLEALQTDLGNINNCVDLTANNLASVGAYAQNISSLLTTNASTGTALTETSSNLVDVNMAQAVSDYSTLSTAYQAALYVMSRAESMSILNYLPA